MKRRNCALLHFGEFHSLICINTINHQNYFKSLLNFNVNDQGFHLTSLNVQLNDDIASECLIKTKFNVKTNPITVMLLQNDLFQCRNSNAFVSNAASHH